MKIIKARKIKAISFGEIINKVNAWARDQRNNRRNLFSEKDIKYYANVINEFFNRPKKANDKIGKMAESITEAGLYGQKYNPSKTAVIETMGTEFGVPFTPEETKAVLSKSHKLDKDKLRG